jgi:hypothetical protein
MVPQRWPKTGCPRPIRSRLARGLAPVETRARGAQCKVATKKRGEGTSNQVRAGDVRTDRRERRRGALRVARVHGLRRDAWLRACLPRSKLPAAVEVTHL